MREILKILPSSSGRGCWQCGDHTLFDIQARSSQHQGHICRGQESCVFSFLEILGTKALKQNWVHPKPKWWNPHFAKEQTYSVQIGLTKTKEIQRHNGQEWKDLLDNCPTFKARTWWRRDQLNLQTKVVPLLRQASAGTDGNILSKKINLFPEWTNMRIMIEEYLPQEKYRPHVPPFKSS